MRWAEHFSEILNRPPPKEAFDFAQFEAMDPLRIRMDPINIEVRSATVRLTNNNAAGEDNISAELLKATSLDNLEQWLHLYNEIWTHENNPEKLENGTIVKIPKKGDFTNCNNWRGITLLSVPGKVFCSSIWQRIHTAISRGLGEEQAGFRPWCSCTDQIFALRNILEQCNDWQTPLILNFVDIQKAVDNADGEALWNSLRMYGLPDKIIHLIETLYRDSECTVLIDGEPTAPCKVKTGVRQGCILSPILFCIALDFVMKSHIAISSGIAWTGNNTRLGDLDFADDICLLNSSQVEMQEKTKVLCQQAAKIGLQIKKKKIETTRNFDVKTPIKLEKDQLNEVDKCTYLGRIVTKNGDCLPDIKNRVSKAGGAMNKLQQFWKDKNRPKDQASKL